MNDLRQPVERWAPDRDAVLLQLWADGKSASEIALQMGDGVTRNAVIGRVHRLKKKAAMPLERSAPIRVTSPRVAPPRRAGNAGQPRITGIRKRAERRATEAERQETAPDARSQQILKSELWLPLPGSTPKSLMAIDRDECRWPLGDPLTAEFAFCGCPAVEGSSYCAPHRRASTMNVGGAR